MTVERTTEPIKVQLTNGQEVEVLIYKYISFREQQKVYNQIMDGLNVKSKKDIEDMEIPATQMFNAISLMAEIVWADKNYKLDDVQGDSLSGAIIERFAGFLGTIGLQAETGNPESS